ncbi:nuclear envelope integral membrane protein 1 [Anoplophora glabripennis]|uniref:nuclear envelope integral membrane protein 1 n=1 Tax=Anoplophora glabripennis TaxID=217634 RepID=UPI000873C113|nr:nuclear envelope integral membrane protein 1 [Anoplophora glabripennis]
MPSILNSFSVLLIISPFFLSCSVTLAGVHYLENGDVHNFKPNHDRSELRTFCYKGRPKYIIHIWQSVILQIDHVTDDYTQYEGPNPEQVQKKHLENRYSWSFDLFTSKQKAIKLNPFNTSCIGVVSKEPYAVNLKVIRIDLWKVLLLVSGVSLFTSAGKLSNNKVFHYLCGVSLGICASFLILIYYISKLVPRKPLMYSVLGCGWTITVYVLQLLWENLRTIFSGYKTYVMWYTVITGVISFILCYRWGPVENVRTKNLIKWSLQLLGLASIYCSTHFEEAAVGQIVILLIVYNLPKKWIAAPKTYWKKKFPPKLKMLTNDEYYEQGVRETAKALDGLRQFCSSPECNQWNTALKLKDVKRFASFIEGNSHLSDEEILEYETSTQGDLTDDEDRSESLTDEEDF